MELDIPAGARFNLSVAFQGPPDAPVLRDFTIAGPRTNGVLIKKSSGFMHDLVGLELYSVTLARGGHLSADYRLLPEQAVDGGISLFRLMFAAAAISEGDGRGMDALSAPLPNTRFDSFRRDIDGQLSSQGEPAIAAFVRSHDGALPGVSLSHIMGLDGQPLPPPAHRAGPAPEPWKPGPGTALLGGAAVAAAVHQRRKKKAQAAAAKTISK
jgi:hypothetical protein